MNEKDLDLLLRTAALSKKNAPPEMPFGFDTRIVALWRGQPDSTLGLARLLRRVAIAALAVIIASAAAAYLESERERENGEPFRNEYAFADSAIQEEIGP